MFHLHPIVADKGFNFSLPALSTTTKRQGCMLTDDGAVTVLSKISNNSLLAGILTDGSKLRMERRLYTIPENHYLLHNLMSLFTKWK